MLHDGDVILDCTPRSMYSSSQGGTTGRDMLPDLLQDTLQSHQVPAACRFQSCVVSDSATCQLGCLL